MTFLLTFDYVRNGRKRNPQNTNLTKKPQNTKIKHSNITSAVITEPTTNMMNIKLGMIYERG